MHAKEQTLKQLLEGDKQYQVPLYQRTYSWVRKDVTTLWADVLDQAEELNDTSEGSGHFLGSLVLAPTPHYVGETESWTVVDGQQRLTTLTLALCALRDHIRGGDPKMADRIHRQFLVNEFADGAWRPKVLPTQDDRASFLAVLEGDPRQAVGNIGDNYRLLRESLLDAETEAENDNYAARLERAITGRLDLVAITADRDDNVHRIFESLNNTGMKLTQGDLLRNYLFMLLPTRAEETYNKVWRPMEKLLGAENLETLAFIDLQVQGNDKVNRSDTYRLQTARISTFDRDETAVVEDIKRLAQRAAVLNQILRPEKADDQEVGAALGRLADWGGEASWPLMLVALERLRDGTATVSQVLDTASYVESYVVRRMLVGRSSAGINRILNQVANDVRDVADLAHGVHRALSAPRRAWPTDAQIREAVDAQPFYWRGRGSQRLFVLRRLEESYGHKEPIDWAAAKPSIEHVMPQTATPEWLTGLTDPDDAAIPPGEVHAAWVHRLGNLTLTAYNSELSANPFGDKRRLYADSSLQLTRRIADYDTWGPTQIRQRGAYLADRIIEIWPAPLNLGPQVQDDPWLVVKRILVALPEGTWTTYGDLAAVTGTHAVPLGTYFASTPVTNAERVLNREGRLSEGFRWPDDRTDNPQQILEGAGIRFDTDGTADPEQRLSLTEIAELVGITVPDDEPDFDDVGNSNLADRFWLQLGTNNGDDVVQGVGSLVDTWHQLGGALTYGEGTQTSLVMVLRDTDPNVWPWVIYPRHSRLEIVFQYLKSRAPFDDSAVREQMRRRLNAIPGVRVDPGRISTRPSIRLSLLAQPEVVNGLNQVSQWFADTALQHSAQPADQLQP